MAETHSYEMNKHDRLQAFNWKPDPVRPFADLTDDQLFALDMIVTAGFKAQLANGEDVHSKYTTFLFKVAMEQMRREFD